MSHWTKETEQAVKASDAAFGAWAVAKESDRESLRWAGAHAALAALKAMYAERDAAKK